MHPNDPNQPPPPSGIYNAPPPPDAGYHGYVNPADSQYMPVDPSVITQFMQPEKLTDEMIKNQQRKSKVASLAVAALVHVLLIALLAVVVVQVTKEDPPELTIAATQSSAENAIEKKEFVSNVKQKPSRPSAKPSNLLVSNVASPVSVPTLEIDVDSPSIGNSFGAGFGNGGFGDGGGGGLAVPSVMKGRCDAADRSKRLRESGGEMKMDRSVIAALRYLKGKQNSDGSWGSVYPVAMTGLALLAYCGHCETVDSPEFGKTVADAIGYLVQKGDGADGLMTSTNGRNISYEHAIAVYALGEAYSLNKNSRKPFAKISPVLKDGAKIVIEGQTNAGGWLYSYGKGGAGDMSVSGWNVQALKATELTGLSVSGLSTAKKKALKYVEDAATKDGKFRYMINDQHKEGKDTLIGVGMLSSRMLGGVAKYEDEGFKIMLAAKPNPNAMNVYSWYYNSQAAFQRGGPIWDDYNKSFQQVVLNSQKEDGSWGGNGGHGDLAGDAPIYVTSLCTLMMEVYYRYLPATDNKKGGQQSGLMDRK